MASLAIGAQAVVCGALTAYVAQKSRAVFLWGGCCSNHGSHSEAWIFHTIGSAGLAIAACSLGYSTLLFAKAAWLHTMAPSWTPVAMSLIGGRISFDFFQQAGNIHRCVRENTMVSELFLGALMLVGSSGYIAYSLGKAVWLQTGFPALRIPFAIFAIGYAIAMKYDPRDSVHEVTGWSDALQNLVGRVLLMSVKPPYPP